MSDTQLDELNQRVSALESALSTINERNQRVESDKAWEVSRFRIGFLTVLTYLVATIVFLAIGVSAPLLNALIPTTGYLLSTQTIPLLKRKWLQQRRRVGDSYLRP